MFRFKSGLLNTAAQSPRRLFLTRFARKATSKPEEKKEVELLMHQTIKEFYTTIAKENKRANFRL